jgi:pimeloyl-ACP methyl ester carboxylesterase
VNKKLTIGVIVAVSLVFIIVYFLSSTVVPYKNEENATDYSKSEHWLSLPASVDKEVDVFYLYPTAWTSTDLNPQICDIDNPSMLVLAPQAFERQATAFETVGNIYAPYYRQLNIEAVSMPHAEEVAMLGGIPTSDAISAFDYYIKHYNKGRPFILVGHSQGANVLSNLLAEYVEENKMVYERMIAAYVIGYPVTPAYLNNNTHLKFAEGPDDTGVIISYNTQAPDVLPGTNPILMGMVGLVINPITWTRDETVATTAQGIGSIMPDPATLQFVPVPQYADAKVDQINGVLICSTADEEALHPITVGLGKGIYHTFDIPFYYYNLRANAENRTKNFLRKNKENATDYSKSEHWLSLPVSVDKEVDIFYLYPTAWQKVNENEPNICDIDNPSMLVGAPQAFARQATAFETVGNIYAPYYRQWGIQEQTPSEEQAAIIVGGIPTLDGISAFDYYIRHYNKGRPFILVGHSQGAIVMGNLLAEYMKENQKVYERMVAAYVIGHAITPAYLDNNTHLKFAKGPDDTGVIISYNTQAPDVLPGTNPALLGMVGIVINPITWTRDETLATTTQGLGSIMPNSTLQFVPVPQYADAKIDQTNGVLICSTADEEVLYSISSGFGKGIYHTYDIPFYYYNLRANAANRTKNFLSKQSTNN